MTVYPCVRTELAEFHLSPLRNTAPHLVGYWTKKSTLRSFEQQLHQLKRFGTSSPTI